MISEAGIHMEQLLLFSYFISQILFKFKLISDLNTKMKNIQNIQKNTPVWENGIGHCLYTLREIFHVRENILTLKQLDDFECIKITKIYIWTESMKGMKRNPDWDMNFLICLIKKYKKIGKGKITSGRS